MEILVISKGFMRYAFIPEVLLADLVFLRSQIKAGEIDVQNEP